MEKPEEMKSTIVCILCKLEKVFPPAFFTIMIHLCLHLPEEAMLAGPVSSKWMYSVERCLRTFKNYVRNKRLPEGSIAEVYVANEALAFCGLYLKGVEAVHSRPKRNIDNQPCTKHYIMAFGQRLRCLGSPQLKELKGYYKKAHWYVLNNHQAELQEYFEEHANTLNGVSDIQLARIQEEQFPDWFKKKMVGVSFGQNDKMKDLYALSQGPNQRYHSWGSCIVNGVRYNTSSRDSLFRTQNSGVTVSSSYDGQEVQFYGVVGEILELSFLLDRKVVLFHCQWYNTNKRQKRIQSYHHLTLININTFWYKDDPFVLATQVKQVFYLQDKKNGGAWKIVQKVNHRSLYEIPEQVEDVDELVDDGDQIDDGPSTIRAAEVDIQSTSLVRNDVPPVIMENLEELAANISLEPFGAFIDDESEELEDNDEREDDFEESEKDDELETSSDA